MSFDTMSPWEALRWFQPPQVTHVTLPDGAVHQIIEANPQRVALIIADSAVTGRLSVSIDLVTQGAFGIPLTTANPYLVLLQSQLGPIVQAAWFGVTSLAPTDVLIMECLLKDWPQGDFDPITLANEQLP
jgi:hypothetical protein